MLQRFVSAVVVPGTLIAVAAMALYGVAHTFTLTNPYRIAFLWCMAPLTWGVWALLAPKSWWPGRLHVWGGILGLLLSSLMMFVLKLPDKVAGFSYSITSKVAGVVVMTVFYAVLWMLVAAIYQKLTPKPEERKLKAVA